MRQILDRIRQVQLRDVVVAARFMPSACVMFADGRSLTASWPNRTSKTLSLAGRLLCVSLILGHFAKQRYRRISLQPTQPNPTPEFTVVYPLIELRGPAIDRVRTWTHQQTLARERYRVVVVSSNTDPHLEHALSALLSEQDELVAAPGANQPAMWNAGARRANSKWIVFTEGHCLAERGCLEALARWVAENPQARAGNFSETHKDETLVDQLSTRWYGEVHEVWEAPDEFPRLYASGCAIRKDEFDASGGFETQFNLFAGPLLSAKLHAQSTAIHIVPGASVLHVDVEDMADHHHSTALYACDEFNARVDGDSVFFERYFGHTRLWANRLGQRRATAWAILRAIVAAVRSRGLPAAALVRFLPTLVTAVVAGVSLRIRLFRFAVALDEFAIEHLPLPTGFRWARFIRAHANVVRLTQLKWIRDYHEPDSFVPLNQSMPIERLGPGMLVGVHGLEETHGRRFRWSEPVMMLRLEHCDGDAELRIDTAGIHGDPKEAIIAVVVEGRVLPDDYVNSLADGTLIVHLPAAWLRQAGGGLIILCTPLLPAAAGRADTRALGLPIAAVEVALRERVHSRMDAA